jgi:hypothetical protein
VTIMHQYPQKECFKMNPQDNQARKESHPALGMAVGIALGVALGVAMDDIAIGLALGVAFGAAFGVAGSRKR